MTCGSSRRRGAALVVVLAAMSIAGGLLAVLAAAAGQRYRDWQAERACLIARAVADSAVIFARARADQWSEDAPEGPIELDVGQLLPPNMTGSATLVLSETDGHRVCHVVARVDRGRYGAIEETDIVLE